MAQQAQQSQHRLRPELSAWFMLIGFFLVFCLIVAISSYGGWRYFNDAMLSIDAMPNGGIVRVHTNAGVVYQPKGRTDLITPRELCADSPRGVTDICFKLDEGLRIRTVPEAGYGPVASLVLPDATQIDLRAHPSGTDITLLKYQVTRWNDRRQEVVFRQDAGYARYDLQANQPYDEVLYTVQIAKDVQVELQPGGSYSINIPHPDDDHPVLTVDKQVLRAEVAVRSGQAKIIGPTQNTVISADQLVQVGEEGLLSAPLPARWELIRDGNFSQHTAEEYNKGTDTWSVISTTRPPAGEQRGIFTVINSCHPSTPDLCPLPGERTTIGQFRREGGSRAQYITGISQLLDLDVSEYLTLLFSAWTRVLAQTVEGAGIDGTECPMMIMIEYRNTSPSDELAWSRTCVYTGAEAPVKQDYIRYVRIERFEWEHLQLDLRELPELKTARYIRQIIIETRGHDYLTEITDLSLIGRER
jgi:hypothetical protein